jgi:glycerophosphoryl diester phosphodiesterase
MVEFDVVLTKDKIPVVYHDFVLCIDQLNSTAAAAAVQNKQDALSNKLLSLAVNQLTYEEVKQNRVS